MSRSFITASSHERSVLRHPHVSICPGAVCLTAVLPKHHFNVHVKLDILGFDVDKLSWRNIYIMVFVNGMPLQSIFTTMVEGISKNNLLAIPYFILAGNFISGGTLGRRLMDALSVFLRHVRAGMPLACLGANAIFGAISGSPPAATAVFAKIVHTPLAESDGDKLATGLVVSAAGLSAIIPPSIAMIVYGIATDTSISRLFMAGILPGLLVVAVIAIYLICVCKKTDHGKFSFREAGLALRRGIPVLILPVIVLGGIYGGILTPTEAGALTAVYCFIVSFFVLRDIDMKQTLHIIKIQLLWSARPSCL